MSGFATAIISGITAFSATNIDDFVILLLFFAQVNSTFRYRHIIVGQYLGFMLLVAASLSGFVGGLVIPPYWIGLLGLVPVAMGLSRLLNPQADSAETNAETKPPDYSAIASFSPQTYSVAIVTIANGSDNVGVYVPLFSSKDLISILIIVGVFLLLIGVWCYVTYRLTRYPAIAKVLLRYSDTIIPFVLIGIGVFIVLESGALNLAKLIASCLCLMILVKKNSNSLEDNEN